MARILHKNFVARGLRTVTAALVVFAAANDAAAAAEEVATLDAVVVTGVQPGPGLWRVTRGSAGEVWILATVTPLPGDMQWSADQVEDILATAQEVIAPAQVEMDISAGDMFKMASLARSANAAIKLPDRERLQDRLPPEQYARWSELKPRLLPDDSKVERQRPLFAAQTLYYAAIRNAGLTRADTAWARVSARAAERGTRVVETTIRPPLALDRKAYRAGIRALAESEVDDMTCFIATLDALEPDLQRFTRAANAWAIGDVGKLLSLELTAPVPPCKPVYDRAMSFQARPQLRAQALEVWRSAVEAAVTGNRRALAVLPLADLAGPAGVLEQLRIGGYTVDAPE